MQEIVDISQRGGCPAEYEKVPIPEWHEFRNESLGGIPSLTHMPFVRTRYDSNTGVSPDVPREQV